MDYNISTQIFFSCKSLQVGTTLHMNSFCIQINVQVYVSSTKPIDQINKLKRVETIFGFNETSIKFTGEEKSVYKQLKIYELKLAMLKMDSK